MNTERFVSVWDVPEQIEFQITEPSEWSCICYIDSGRIYMVGPLDPPELTLFDQHDRIVCTQERDNPCHIRLVRGLRP